MRLPYHAAAVASLFSIAGFIVGCDPAPEPAPPPSTTAPTTAATSDAAPDLAAMNTQRAARLAAEPRARMPLVAIPFTIETPKQSWLLQASVGNKVVLHGVIPSGEIDLLLGTEPRISAESLTLLLKQTAKPTTQPRVINEVSEHDGIHVIKQVEPLGPPGMSDPELIPMRWAITLIVKGEGLGYAVYDLNVIGLSQGMFDRDEKFIQQIVDTLRFEPASTRPAVP